MTQTMTREMALEIAIEAFEHVTDGCTDDFFLWSAEIEDLLRETATFIRAHGIELVLPEELRTYMTSGPVFYRELFSTLRDDV